MDLSKFYQATTAQKWQITTEAQNVTICLKEKKFINFLKDLQIVL